MQLLGLEDRGMHQDAAALLAMNETVSLGPTYARQIARCGFEPLHGHAAELFRDLIPRQRGNPPDARIGELQGTEQIGTALVKHQRDLLPRDLSGIEEVLDRGQAD